MSAPPRGGALAIDHGTKRTGFAIADPLRIALQALEAFHGPGASAELLDHVGRLLEERTVTTFVVGFPYDVDGGEGGRARDVGAFTERLHARFPAVAIVRYDERLTTKAAEDLLREAGHHGKARKERRDSWSALVLLRDWIESGEPAGR